VRTLRYDSLLTVLVAMTGFGFLVLAIVWLSSRSRAVDPFEPGMSLVVVACVLALCMPFIVIGIWFGLRNEYVDGVTPGVMPTAGDGARVRLGQPDVVVAVRFSPPDEMRPAEMGVVLAGGVDSRHLAATVVDLVRRGHIDVTTTAAGQQLMRGAALADDARGYERLLLEGLFRGQPVVTSAELTGRSRALLGRVRSALGREAVERGWLRDNPAREWRGGVVVGIVLAVFGLMTLRPGAGESPGAGAGWAWVPFAWFLPAATIAAIHCWPIGRTAVGTVLAQQATGFELYLTTAEAAQLRFDESSDHVARYLPYAIALGQADRWRRVIDDLVAAGDGSAVALSDPVPGWVAQAPLVERAIVASGPAKPATPRT